MMKTAKNDELWNIKKLCLLENYKNVLEEVQNWYFIFIST